MLNGGKRVDHCAAAFAAQMRFCGANHLRVDTRSYALQPHTRLESHMQTPVKLTAGLLSMNLPKEGVFLQCKGW